MKIRHLFFTLVVIGLAAHVIFIYHNPTANPNLPTTGIVAKIERPAKPTLPVAPDPKAISKADPPSIIVLPSVQSTPVATASAIKPIVAAQKSSEADISSFKINGYSVKDPDARAALSLVGKDSHAELYWTDAINDPNLPAKERKDLIEDLNEDGLIDPKHPTAEDMPVIASRIQLIEQLAPDAMDTANADAFAEAYKDLINLYTGRGAD